jgi:hypothetical protein
MILYIFSLRTARPGPAQQANYKADSPFQSRSTLSTRTNWCIPFSRKKTPQIYPARETPAPALACCSASCRQSPVSSSPPPPTRKPYLAAMPPREDTNGASAASPSEPAPPPPQQQAKGKGKKKDDKKDDDLVSCPHLSPLNRSAVSSLLPRLARSSRAAAVGGGPGAQGEARAVCGARAGRRSRRPEAGAGEHEVRRAPGFSGDCSV